MQWKFASHAIFSSRSLLFVWLGVFVLDFYFFLYSSAVACIGQTWKE